MFSDTEKLMRTVHWKFLGLTELLPIYEKLEDGAEILWREHYNRSLRKILSKVKKKSELGIFDDTLAFGDMPYGGEPPSGLKKAKRKR